MLELKFRFNHPDLKKRRRALRKNQTKAEALLWDRLRGRRLCNIRFLRQYSIGAFILDFYAPTLLLAVELDGRQHAQAQARAYDRERSFFLEEKRIKVLRFWNSEVHEDLDAVVKAIEQYLESLPPSYYKRGVRGEL